jgi:hypothetical protein
MKIIEGTLPSVAAWRAVILLNINASLSLVWQLALALTRANNGQLIAAAVIPEGSNEHRQKAQQILAQVRTVEQRGASQIWIMIWSSSVPRRRVRLTWPFSVTFRQP